MNRTELTERFLNCFFNNETFNTEDEASFNFVKMNGLCGFPILSGERIKKGKVFWQIRKMRLKELLEEFREGFPEYDLLNYKGIDMEKYYPDNVMRVYSDIDLLTNPESFKKLRKNLVKERESILFIKDDLNIEIKYDFYDRYYHVFLGQRAKQFQKRLYDENTKEIGAVDNFILLCLHNFAHQFSRLDRFFDLYFLIEKEQIDLDDVLEKANTYKLGLFVEMNVFLMNRIGFPVRKEIKFCSKKEYLLERLYETNKNRYKFRLMYHYFNFFVFVFFCIYQFFVFIFRRL